MIFEKQAVISVLLKKDCLAKSKIPKQAGYVWTIELKALKEARLSISLSLKRARKRDDD